MERAGSGLEKLVARSLRRAPQADAPLAAWPLVCGSKVAERTRAISFSGSILRVEVPDFGWCQELRHLVPRYLRALANYTGQKVEKIEFIIPRR